MGKSSNEGITIRMAIDHNKCAPLTHSLFARPGRWNSWDFVLLGFCLALGGLMVSRSAGLLFQGDDLRFMWWAHERLHQPWRAFSDPPLFALYYRPILSLIWWFHYLLFGTNEFMHQMAVGCWWLLLQVLLYGIGRIVLSRMAGFLSCLFFLSFCSPGSLILWKSWITITTSLLFQYFALIALYLYFQRQSLRYLGGYLIFAALACFSKESALLCLPITSIALLLAFPLSVPRILALVGGALAFVANFYIVKSRTAFLYQPITISQAIEQLSFFSHHILEAPGVQVFCACVIGAAYLEWGKWRMAGRIGVLLSAAFVWFVKPSLAISNSQAISFTLILLSHGLIFTRSWRYMIVPVMGLAVTFWPFALFPQCMSAYGADASLALAVLMGWTLHRQCRRFLL